MVPPLNYTVWRDRVLQLRQRHTKKEDLEFCDLVEQVAGVNDLNIIKTLLETFTATCETGVQQTVIRNLGSFDILLYYKAYLEALPRLVSEGSGWEIELGSYPERDPRGAEIWAIARIVKNFPDENRNLFIRVLKDKDFRSDHVWAESLVRAIQA